MSFNLARMPIEVLAQVLAHLDAWNLLHLVATGDKKLLSCLSSGALTQWSVVGPPPTGVCGAIGIPPPLHVFSFPLRMSRPWRLMIRCFDSTGLQAMHGCWFEWQSVARFLVTQGTAQSSLTELRLDFSGASRAWLFAFGLPRAASPSGPSPPSSRMYEVFPNLTSLSISVQGSSQHYQLSIIELLERYQSPSRYPPRLTQLTLPPVLLDLFAGDPVLPHTLLQLEIAPRAGGHCNPMTFAFLAQTQLRILRGLVLHQLNSYDYLPSAKLACEWIEAKFAQRLQPEGVKEMSKDVDEDGAQIVGSSPRANSSSSLPSETTTTLSWAFELCSSWNPDDRTTAPNYILNSARCVLAPPPTVANRQQEEHSSGQFAGSALTTPWDESMSQMDLNTCLNTLCWFLFGLHLWTEWDARTSTERTGVHQKDYSPSSPQSQSSMEEFVQLPFSASPSIAASSSTLQWILNGKDAPLFDRLRSFVAEVHRNSLLNLHHVRASDLVVLPPTLTELEITTESYAKILLQHMPSSTTRLDLTLQGSLDLIFKAATEEEADQTAYLSPVGAESAAFSQLPARFRLPLPTSLRHLRLVFDDFAVASMNNNSNAVLLVLESVPKSLTRLEVPNLWLRHPPSPGQPTISFFGLLPPQLHFLECAASPFDASDSANLPRTLESMRMEIQQQQVGGFVKAEFLAFHAISSLPSGLVHLRCPTFVIPCTSIIQLPRSLLTLVIARIEPSDRSAAEIGEKVAQTAVWPPNLTCLSLIGPPGGRSPPFTSRLLGHNGSPAPLRGLEAARTVYWTDALSCLLPTTLTTLEIDSIRAPITASSLQLLPRSIRQLVITNSSCIIPASVIGHLPPQITCLAVSIEEEGSEEPAGSLANAIQSLPRSLASLEIASSSMTDEMIGLLPSTLTYLDVFQCDSLTPNAVAHLPLCTRHVVLPNDAATELAMAEINLSWKE